ncbi:MAG: PAS domain S-box protein [Breznakibacter sp.]
MEYANDSFERLLAENMRLKRLVSRLSERELSQAGSMFPAENQPILLPAAVGEALSGKALFSEKIKSALLHIDKFADCERAVLFHYNKTTRSHIILQSGVGQPSAVTPSHMDVWESIQSFLQDIGNGPWELVLQQAPMPEALLPFFDQARQTQSLLLFPLWAGDGPTGFLAFEETAFCREWFTFEKELLKLSAMQLSDAFMRNRDQIELEKKESINNYLLKIAETFSHNDRFEVQARHSLETTAKLFGFSRVLLFENTDSDNCRAMDEYVQKNAVPIKDSLQNISFTRHLPGLYDMLKVQKVLMGSDVQVDTALNILNRGTEVSRLVIGIHSTNGLQGFMCFEDVRPERRWADDEINAFVVVADLFASAFERQHAMDHMVSSHQEAIRLTRQLRDKENFLESILSSVPLGIMLVRNRELLYANRFLQEQSALTETELIGQKLSQFYYPGQNDTEMAEAFYQQINREGVGSMETVMRNHLGQPIHSIVIGKQCPVNGLRDTYLIIAQDVTLLKQAQSELMESEERYRKIIETTIEGVLLLESPEETVFVNTAAKEMIGLTDSNAQSFEPGNLFASTIDLSRFREAFALIAQGLDFKGDFNIKTEKGLLVPVEVYGSRIILKGKPLFYFSLRNITDRKKHEAVLMQSEEKFRTLSENTTDQIIRIANDGTLLFANQAFKQCYRFGPMDLTDQQLSGISQIPDALAQAIGAGCKRAAGEHGSCQTEASFVLFNQTFSIEWRISPEFGPNGEVASFLCSGRDMTQRKMVEQELLEAKEKAESADKLKSAFLANLSHEVRTPLNAIVGFSTLLKEGDATPVEQEEFMNIIIRSSDHLMALISDLIDIAKIESGVMNISKCVFAVNDLLRDTYLLFQKRIKLEKRNAIEQIILDIPHTKEEPLAESDPNRITQILNNLLDNAIKFTPQGIITFGYRIESGMFRFFVKDTGIGIENDKLGIIFLPFRQGDESISKKYGGTGLGLSISKKLTEALGGNIHVDSVPGEGSTFFFEIPDNNLRRPMILPLLKSSGLRPVEPIPRTGYFWADKIVLLVDDNSNSHLRIRKILEKTGVTLISARTAASARELIKKRQAIDLILFDMEMPGIDVAGFLKQIKHFRYDLPVIAQSEKPIDGRQGPEVSLVDEWLEKPLDREQLLYKMSYFFGRDKITVLR